jgi:predicted HNH restriction endonuclease
MNAAKLKYFKKIYDNAPMIKCACGCGAEIKSVDHYARPHRFITGHNTERKYDDPTQYKREWNHRNRSARLAYKQKRSRKIKGEFITSQGSKCSICETPYTGKNASMFQFHHNDPNIKIFNITLNSISNESLKELREELAKCSLICSNCHFQLHSSEY